MADIVTYTEETMAKVLEALKGLEFNTEECADIVKALHNAGILFCERVPMREDDAFARITTFSLDDQIKELNRRYREENASRSSQKLFDIGPRD
jgi:hypothetical protein